MQLLESGRISCMARSKIFFNNYSKEMNFDDFIYNRFDKQGVNKFDVITIDTDGIESNIQVHLNDTEAIVGCWLIQFDKCIYRKISKLIFHKYKPIKTIYFPFIFKRIGFGTKKVHYDLFLEKDLIVNTTKRKHVRDMQKQRTILTEAFGEEKLSIFSSPDCPNEIMDFYFQNKFENMKIQYSLNKEEYFKKYNVSHIYALYYGERLVSVLLSCEQCFKVFLENLTYDKELSKNSPGKLIYVSYLNCLIEKGFKHLYLGGGDYEYKRYFGSTKQELFNCVTKRNKIVCLIMYLKHIIKRIIGR